MQYGSLGNMYSLCQSQECAIHCYVHHKCLLPKWLNGISGVKLEGKVTETKATGETRYWTTAELMFHHGVACTHPV